MALDSSCRDGVLFSWFRRVRASAPAGCSPRGPGGVELLLQGLFLFSCLSEEFLSYLLSPQVRVRVAGVSARLQEEPSSLRTEREVRQGSSWLLVRPSRFLFAWKEGWNVPGYPRWARAWALPVSCYRVVRVEARTPFAKGRLVVWRRTPRVPEDFSSRCQAVRWA